MNSFLNRFNNTMKASRADKKWNLIVYKSPEPKIVCCVTYGFKINLVLKVNVF